MKTIFALAGVVLMTAGCATVTRGTTGQVTFNSEPSGAQMRTSLGHTCPTPCTLEIPRKSDFVAVFTKDGYKEQQIPIATRVAGSGAAGFAGNILVGGLVGMGVDAATGSTLEHFPNPVNATLEALHRAPAPTVSRRGRAPKAIAPAPDA
ncbi:hypothetical protein GCM10007036_35410 [Alsobacter metallidurans]|uniref:Translation initiation factor 2 n=2 Tax=Alsobacter metallidurans TaxID=340221 RepID=A0A917I975_9HYPH|nr:hypothetical protein GCM10007036_35410 [Alsobacter metallidurans]